MFQEGIQTGTDKALKLFANKQHSKRVNNKKQRKGPKQKIMLISNIKIFFLQSRGELCKFLVVHVTMSVIIAV